MKKVEIIEEIMAFFKIFYPYLVKLAYNELFRDKISESLVLYTIKKLERRNLVKKLFDLEFLGNYSWGLKVRRSIYVYTKEKSSYSLDKSKLIKLRNLKRKFLLELMESIKKSNISNIKKEMLLNIVTKELNSQLPDYSSSI